MVSAYSIGAAKAGGYARYLESKTLTPELGDYYLTPDGEPTQAPGRWLASPETLARLGIEREKVEGEDFVALMEGRHPGTGRWLRREGAGGGRGGGIDVVFSPPKSVSAVWALGDDRQRAEMEAAHAAAVDRAMQHLRETVPTVRRRYGAGVVEEPAVDLVAAEYRHTTSRGVFGADVPDPQLHSHVVITSAVRDDGRVVAVASRPVFRAARELGAYYRSALAGELQERGYGIEAGTGKDGRYFEIEGVPVGLREAFSARSREVAREAERFRARHGREPERRELREIVVRTRSAKRPVTKHDLQRAWDETAARYRFTGSELQPDRERGERERGERGVDGSLGERVEGRLTERAATFQASELRAVVLEQSVGQLDPEGALGFAREMIAERRVIPLEGGLMTTLKVRAAEQAIERHITQLATPTDRQVGEQARELAREQVAERIGGPLSPEQQQALQTITGPERAAVLIGPAGTGKGVVIDAAALAEQHAGREPIGVAVSWSTAERLASDSQALHGRTFSVDALLTRQEHGLLEVGEGTTIFFDEAGMADTRRLHDLTSMVDRTGAKLVLIGDAAQLPSIGAGGMFDRLTRIAPCVELSDVRRTLNPAEQKAWADLRAGRSDRAMAYYHSIGQLHMNDTRDQAVEYAVNSWAELTKTLPVQEVALLSDASNHEIHRLNARAQHHRYQRGELGDTEAPVPGMHYGLRQGDRIVLVKPLRQPGVERVENGSDGHVLDVTEKGEVLVHFDLSGQQRTLRGEELEKVRLAYARHIHRAQGATVTRSLVVTGGWQTSKEPAYVHASRARNGTDWFINRTDLGQEGQDHHRISRLAQRMQESRAQIPSLQHPELPDPEWGLHAGLDRAPSRTLLANMPRLIERLAEPLSREPER